MGRFGHWEILIIVFIIVMIFGVKRLPEMGRGLGKGIANFRESIKGTAKEDDDATAAEQLKTIPADER